MWSWICERQTKPTCGNFQYTAAVYKVNNTIYFDRFEGPNWYCSKDFFFLSGSKWFTETHGKPKVLWSVNSWHLSTRERQNNRWNRCDNNERLYAGMWLASFTVFLISTGGTWYCSSKALSTFRPWTDYDLSHQNRPSWWLAVHFPSSNITWYLFP